MDKRTIQASLPWLGKFRMERLSGAKCLKMPKQGSLTVDSILVQEDTQTLDEAISALKEAGKADFDEKFLFSWYLFSQFTSKEGASQP